MTIPGLDQPAVHRYGHTFEVAWVQKGTTTGAVLMTRRFDSRTGAKKGGTHKVMPAWSVLNDQPQLLSYQSERMLVFAGIRNSQQATPYNASEAYYLTSGDGKDWILQAGSLSHAAGIAASLGLAAVSDAGTPVTAYAISPDSVITFHEGVSLSIPASTPDGTTKTGGTCCVYDPGLGRDLHNGRVWVAWYSDSTLSGWNGIHAQIIPTGKRNRAPDSVVTSGGKPRSVSPNQTVQVASRPRANKGGVYTAYAIGYPAPRMIGLWRLGSNNTNLRIQTSHLVRNVGIAPGTGGRLWLYWWDAVAKQIKVVLTNRKATAVASRYTLSPPNQTSYQALNLVGDGSDAAKRRLNLVAVMGGTVTRIYYTQIKP